MIRKSLFFFLIIGIFSCSYFWDLKIINNPAYSIGLVGNYVPPSGASVVFEYDVSGKIMHNSYQNGAYRWNVPSGGVHIGDKYMVQYDSLDPATARMLFSYPVRVLGSRPREQHKIVS